MTNDPVDLDGRRTAAGRIAADIRRHALQELASDREARRRRQEELEAQLLASPDEWTRTTAKAQYLSRLNARTPDAGNAPQEAHWVVDFPRLIDQGALSE